MTSDADRHAFATPGLAASVLAQGAELCALRDGIGRRGWFLHHARTAFRHNGDHAERGGQQHQSCDDGIRGDYPSGPARARQHDAGRRVGHEFDPDEYHGCPDIYLVGHMDDADVVLGQSGMRRHD